MAQKCIRDGRDWESRKSCVHENQVIFLTCVDFYSMSSQKTTPRTRRRVITDPAKRAWSSQGQTARRKAKAVRSPDDVIRDVRGLKLRQRVSLVLNDQNIREELEDIVHSAPKGRIEGTGAYQDFLLPTTPGQCLPLGCTIAPISDIRGSETLNYPKQERLLRCKLAAVCRLVDILGWSFSIFSQITVSLWICEY